MESPETGKEINTKSLGMSVYQDIGFPASVEGKSFVRSKFIDVAARGTTFKKCDFSHSIFIRAYFRDAKFIECSFVGARFYDSNFRHAVLTGSDFEYAIFQGTIMQPREVIANLPEWPNVRQELLRSHRVNAQGIGDMEAVRLYIREEMAALREHYRRAREKKQEYYSQKYGGLINWLKVRWKSFILWINWITWGYGEHPIQLFKFAIISLLILAIVVYIQTSDNPLTMTVKEMGTTLFQSIKSTIYLFLGLPQASQTSVHWAIASIIIMLRYVILGLFIAVLFRRFSKR